MPSGEVRTTAIVDAILTSGTLPVVHTNHLSDLYRENPFCAQDPNSGRYDGFFLHSFRRGPRLSSKRDMGDQGAG